MISRLWHYLFPPAYTITGEDKYGTYYRPATLKERRLYL